MCCRRCGLWMCSSTRSRRRNSRPSRRLPPRWTSRALSSKPSPEEDTEATPGGDIPERRDGAGSTLTTTVVSPGGGEKMASGIGRRRAAALSDGGTAYRERRQKIIAAAAGVFQEKGFGAASLGDVAIALGTDRASLYYYVSSKEELFHEVVYTAAEDSVLRAEAIRDGDGTTTEKLSALVHSLLSSFEEHYPYLYVYI